MRVLGFVFAVVLVVVGAWMWQAPSDAQEPKKPVVVADDLKIPKESVEQPMSFWMSKKLDYSKSMLEQLTKGDFEALERDAARLRALGKMEGLVRRKNPDYVTQLQTFDTAMAELVRHARKNNPEGSVLAFNQMTSSCVACHVLIRQGVD
jgi:hypothetical protein